MSEYTEQAETFLKETDAKFSIEYVGLAKPEWDKGEYRQAFKFTISKGNRKYTSSFYSSLEDLQAQAWKVTAFRLSSYARNTSQAAQEYIANNRGQHKSWDKAFCPSVLPSAYDILACLVKSDPGTIDDFVSEFGYTPSKNLTISQIIKTYEAVKAEYQALISIFSDDEMQKLQEVA